MAEKRSILDLLEAGAASEDVGGRVRRPDGALAVLATGPDPFVIVTGLDLPYDWRRRPILDVTLAVEPAPEAPRAAPREIQVFYRENGAEPFREECSVRASLACDGRPERIALDLSSASGKPIRELRVDLANLPGRITVLKATLGVEERTILDLLERSPDSEDLVARSRDAAGALVIEAVGSDPFILIPGASLEVGPRRWAILEMTVTAELAAGAAAPRYPHVQLYYRTAESDAFEESRSLSEPVPLDGSPARVAFRLRSPYPLTIRALRFDPANFPGRVTISAASLRVEDRPARPVRADFPALAPVLAHGRGGGTLLMKLLSMHPRVTTNNQPVYEGWLLTYFVKFYEMLRAAPMQGEHEDILRNIEPMTRSNVLGPPIGFQEGVDIEEFAEDYRGFLRTYLPKLFATAGFKKADSALYYSEKIALAYLPPLVELFPETKVLTLFRDPRKTYLSIKSFELKNHYKDWSGRYEAPIDVIRGIMTASRCKVVYTKSDILERRFLRLRYEDLLLDPVASCRRICDFLELAYFEEFRDAVVDYVRKAEGTDFYRRHQTSGSLRDSLAGSWDRITDEEKEIFLEDAALFEELGYAA